MLRKLRYALRWYAVVILWFTEPKRRLQPGNENTPRDLDREVFAGR